MKKLFVFLSAVMFAFSVQATQFEEGKYYQVLDVAKSTQPKVTEFFSFYCPHCYKFEAVIKNLKPALAKNVKFEKVHVAFMGNDMAVPMAKSYATMVVLGVEDKMVPAMFKQIHELGQRPKNEDELRQLFINNGIDPDKYDEAYNGAAVNAMQRKFDIQFEASTLTGVPGVLVNNKYIVKPNAIRSYDEYNQLVNYLLTL
ncbi:thiol:disulfide interchange protein DsbA/DsbL [Aliivibrio fischeri]|uniref:Thiol:disulfide interchange protein n=1 Tax=Aliivibrio fischeri (strain MJ11) TaxID=388396 RepID=B5FAZ0_ALIFM|nr:thiol:disulfide interchange protein DsbA/DsbL [Aliivibrio fischeri]ACH67128.1 thiol:disulfide interchange protein DsbA [Aliivibrio fischeri MJ11]MCE4937500.1 thiol:disulfide interchange protein DsbA/DsbL [Aliivibrio fischeri]MUH98453.1 thioredoxin domain-containing protein [Aliivibrio fischeri]MUI65955.1 thioredoxin domain-containing protein [Aliivibrio fischeri]MUJ30186.1 thioredoxin domain-containing protein [Aliivibrio fischeri]